jgi:Asp-tRNA(Asn)/Glu-tRNA(Gln) amidotransferase A subunit family amidase
VGKLAEGAATIARGEESSAALVAHALEAAERLQPALNSFTMLFSDDARARAADADRRVGSGAPLGLLHGVPVAVKDLFDVSGAVTSGCCRAYAERVAGSDAATVAALRRAGAIVIGKTNMHELAFGPTNEISAAGAVSNPWDPACMPGGSSGGSAAAVAARIVPMALGTDTGGSVRIPAAFCGVSGLKTTHGLISLDGVMPLSLSLDTVGPIAVDVVDLTLSMEVLSGLPPPLVDGDLSGTRVGLPRDVFAWADPQAVAVVSSAAGTLAGRGAGVEEIELPWIGRAREAWRVAVYEFGRVHAHLLGDPNGVSPAIHSLIRAGAAMTRADYDDAVSAADEVRAGLGRTFDRIDVLLTPTTPTPAPRHDEDTVRLDGRDVSVDVAPAIFTLPFNVPGAPALQLPGGFSGGGLPLGFQVVGPRSSESLLLRIGATYQAATDWHERVPPNAA